MIPQLEAWDNFYVIVGSSAAALTGLMFVVIALIADDTVTAQKSSGTVAAFGTPNIVHFCAALIVLHRARRQTEYKPVLEDWLWHTVFPLTSYTAIVIASALLFKNPERSLFAVAAAILSLVLIGIHNAWDTVTYLAMGERNRQNASQNTEK